MIRYCSMIFAPLMARISSFAGSLSAHAREVGGPVLSLFALSIMHCQRPLLPHLSAVSSASRAISVSLSTCRALWQQPSALHVQTGCRAQLPNESHCTHRDKVIANKC